MYESVKILNKESDKSLKVKAIQGFDYAKKVQAVPVTTTEFYETCKSQPIVFTKSEAGEYSAMALLGLQQDTNLFVNDDGEWQSGMYVPAFVRRYPFIFIKVEDKLALGFDDASGALNEDEGAPLFTESGEAAEGLDNVMKFMETYQQELLRTQELVKTLDEFGLLEAARVDGNLQGEEFALSGFMRVNEAKFNDLEDDKVLQLAKLGINKLVVAHLISLSNLNKMIQL